MPGFIVRTVVVPDLDHELTVALTRLEEILIHLGGWEDDHHDSGDGEDAGAELRWPLAGGTALEVVRRLWDVLAPTQSRTVVLPSGDQSEPKGPRLLGPDGRYEHMPLRFVDINPHYLDTLAATAAELGRGVATGHDDITNVVREFTRDRETPADVVAEAARLHGMLDLAWTDDVQQLHATITAAGDADTVLTPELEAAYQRTAARLNHMWALGSGLDRFQY